MEILEEKKEPFDLIKVIKIVYEEAEEECG